MHKISKKDLSDAEMDTLTKSCSPTIVITANGEVQTHEEATVYVKELDIFLTLKVLENTPAVLSLGKLCDENGYSCEWINGQKPHLIKNGIRTMCNTENFVPIVVPGLSSSSSGSSSTLKTPLKQESHSSSSSSSSSRVWLMHLSESPRHCVFGVDIAFAVVFGGFLSFGDQLKFLVASLFKRVFQDPVLTPTQPLQDCLWLVAKGLVDKLHACDLITEAAHQ